MVELPPDLARLGDDLAGAARRTARRERRRRIAVAAAVGAVAFAGMTPAALGPAERQFAFADATRFEPPGCDYPRARFMMAACKGAMILYRPEAVQ
jgi:hypothetical protein